MTNKHWRKKKHKLVQVHADVFGKSQGLKDETFFGTILCTQPCMCLGVEYLKPSENPKPLVFAEL